MIRFIQWLIFGHLHTDETIREAEYERRKNGKVFTSGRKYLLRCTGCGRLKVFFDMDGRHPD